VQKLNRNAFLILIVVGIGVGTLSALSSCDASASDDDVIRRFKANKATYQRLRDLLVDDASLREVGNSGVKMADSPVFVVPPTAQISTAKFDEYINLLSSAGGSRASRSEGSRPNICIGAWSVGWAGDSKHKNVCWFADASADHGRFTVKPIESNWYLVED
jgi:hypothetical protein